MTKARKEWAEVCDKAEKAGKIDAPSVAVEEIRRVVEATNGYDFEHMVAVFLNNKMQKVGMALIGVGGFTSSAVVPAVLFKKFFMTKGATAIIVGHNHPSGDVLPSDDDIAFAKRLDLIASELQVELLDNLVVTHDDFYRIGR